MKQCLIAVLVTLALAACSPKAPTPSAQLDVEGSAFVLTLADGSTLRAAELTGAVVQFADADGVLRPLRLSAIEEDPEQPALWRHDFEMADDEGQWHSVCEPDIEGATWGFPVALPEGHPGWEARITLTCASGAVAKCARFGYTPWGSDADRASRVELHAACVHMVRADYCADDAAWTRDGTAIDIYDDLGIQVSDGDAADGFAFEAGWTPQGAVCVAQTRWPDLLDRAELLQRCPRLAELAECDETTARAAGAQLFNRSLPR